MKKIIIILMFMGLLLSLFATEMIIHKTDGTTASFDINEIESITFAQATSNEWIVFDDHTISAFSNLWKVRADGSELYLLTNDGTTFDSSANFRRQGDWIVFCRASEADEEGYSNVFKIKIDGSGLTQLTFFTDKRIAYPS